jgi:hypothetical protein
MIKLTDLLLKEYSEKVYNDRIAHYKSQQPNLEPDTIRSYIKRFEDLKSKIKNMFEKNEGDTDGLKLANYEKIIKLIPRNIQEKNKFMDIYLWDKFSDLESIIDIFPSSKRQQKKAEAEILNSVNTDAKSIYNQNGIEVYLGDEQHSCVKYGAKGSKAEYYTWCISKSSDTQNMYGAYRFREGKSRVFYFVFDRSRSDKRTNYEFEDPLHAIVIHVFENSKFKMTNADNNPNEEPRDPVSFSDLLSYIKKEYSLYQPDNIISALKSLESKISYVKPSAEEVELQALKGKRLSSEQFQALSYNTKKLYVQTNAKDIPTDIFILLDTDLKNLAINNDRECSYEELKNNQSLLKRYAVYRYTRYPTIAIPTSFLKFLPEDLKLKYYNDFENKLTYDLIKDNLGENTLKQYIDDNIKIMGYLPEDAVRYMNSKQKQLYEVYSLFTTDSKLEFGDDENSKQATTKQIVISPVSAETFNKFDSKQKQQFLSIVKQMSKNKNNAEKYACTTMGIPTVLLISGKYYFITYEKYSDDSSYCIMDENGRILFKNIDPITIDLLKNGEDIKEYSLSGFYPSNSNTMYFNENDFDTLSFNKVDDYEKTIELTPAQISQGLKEHIQEFKLNQHRFKYLAGIVN